MVIMEISHLKLLVLVSNHMTHHMTSCDLTEYPRTVPYVYMRGISALCGFLLVPCVYQVCCDVIVYDFIIIDVIINDVIVNNIINDVIDDVNGIDNN